MTRHLTIASVARLAVTAAALMIVGFFMTPAIARAAPNAQGGTSGISPRLLSLPFVTAMQGGTAPVITSTPGLTGTVGVTYTYSVTSTGSPTPTVSLEQSPEGMTIDEGGLIQWMPAASGAFSVTVVARNGSEPDAAQSFAVDVAELEVVIPERIWDPRLDQRFATLVEADVPPGAGYWRLVEAQWLNETESQGRHHILMNVLDENGIRKAGVPLLISWADGSATVASQEKPGEPFAADYAMYAVAPAYNARPIAAAPADRVDGMGLGELDAPDFGHHTSYILTWRWTVMPR